MGKMFPLNFNIIPFTLWVHFGPLSVYGLPKDYTDDEVWGIAG